MTSLVLAATLWVIAQSDAPPAAPPAAPPDAPDAGPSSDTSAAPPSFLDRAQAAHAVKAGQAGVANALVPGTVAQPTRVGVEVDRLLIEAEAQLAPSVAKDGAKPKPDPKRAIVLFQRALAADPTRAAPLWGLSRAHDALSQKDLARHYAFLVIRSQAKDRTQEMAAAAGWRVEQPE